MRISTRRLAIAAAVTATAVIVTSPAWAAFPDQGKRILYVRQPVTTTAPPGTPLRGAGAPYDMFSIKPNGDDRSRVTDSGKVNEYGGYYSPDGERIVYWGQTLGGYQVFSANAEGGRRQILTNNPVSVNPNWSRNGSRIVYVKYTGATTTLQLGGPLAPGHRGIGSANLMIMNADGTGKHSILSGQVYGPGWSPTAPEIAFSGPVKGGIAIYLVSPDGGTPDYLCCKGGTAVFADWSPDGRRLLFLYVPPAPPVGPSTGIQLVTIRRNGTGLVPVTDDSYESTLPRYSNDGERVIYAKDSGDGTLDIYSIRSDGTGGRKRLTETPGYHEWLNYLIG